jgi:hypothetical protein
MSETAQEQRDHAHAALDHMDVSTGFDDVSGDDRATWSAGAQWCVTVWDAAHEAWTEERFDHASDRADFDVASEIADAVNPIYTHNRWLIFTDLCAYSSEYAEGDEAGSGSMTAMAGGVLYEMANDAILNLVREWREDEDEDED